MNAKIQKEYKLIIGTNDTTKDEAFIDENAVYLENLGNNKLEVRVHIFDKDKEEEEDTDKIVDKKIDIVCPKCGSKDILLPFAFASYECNKCKNKWSEEKDDKQG